MFSRFTNAQNKTSAVPITAVLWEYTNNGGASYTDLTTSIAPQYSGSAFSIRVKSVSPAGATYSQVGGASTTNVNDAPAQIIITGTAPYTGSFTSPTITVIARTITATSSYPADPIDPNFCGISEIAGFTVSINGMVGGTVPVSILFNNVLCAVEAGNVNEGRVSSSYGTSPYQNVQVSGGNFTFYTTYNNPPNYFQVAVNNATYSGSTNSNYSVANLSRNITNSCGT